jgi:hypothetical protein
MMKIKSKIATVSRFVVVLCVGLVFMAVSASAQSAGATVTLAEREVTLRELFAQIKRQTGATVSFWLDNAALGKRVTLPRARGTVAEMLDAALPAEGLSWKLVESYILIGPARPVRPAPKPAEPVELPILVGEDNLKNFAAEPERGPDSVYTRTVERGPFEFSAPDMSLATPGTVVSTGVSRRRLSGFALKTNVLHGAVGLAPNLYGEVGLGRRTSIEAGFARNGWNRYGTRGENRKVHGGVTGEFRWWMCERFNGHFFGAHAFWRFYNVGGNDVPLVGFERDFRYEGTAVGGGLTYGYALPIAPRWNLEFHAGIGVAHMSYEKFGCAVCADPVGKTDKTYLLPTRAAVTLSFIIK